MKKPKIYILVKNFSGVNQDVELLGNSREAEKAFKRYTGFSYSTQYDNPESERYNERFSETKIYELDLPDFLGFRRSNSNPKR